jgi:hypothetical protein
MAWQFETVPGEAYTLYDSEYEVFSCWLYAFPIP